MTTSVLDRVPVDQIGERARKARPGVTLARLVVGILFGAGWLAAKVLGVTWLAFAWVWSAVAEGWQAAHGLSRTQKIAALEAECEDLKVRLSRFSG
jgi:hypothetical protein